MSNQKLLGSIVGVISVVFLGAIILYYCLPNIRNAQAKPTCANCSTGSVCMNTLFLGTPFVKMRCEKSPEKSKIPNVMIPFDKNTDVTCTHGSGIGTHSWANAYWAIDLATPYHLKNATIYASADGVAYTSKIVCKEPIGTAAGADVSDCGDGWGNWVKVYHGQGYYTFYAHLDSVLIKNGTIVHQGDPIGIEGWTGQAGDRHLHWSLQKLPGKTEEQWQKQILTYAGESVPFEFLANGNDRIQKIDVSTLVCAYMDTKVNKRAVLHGVVDSK